MEGQVARIQAAWHGIQDGSRKVFDTVELARAQGLELTNFP